jgi:cold shock CspA family protein
MRYQGKITDWKDDRSFGFIMPGGGGTPVFLHISAFKKGQQRPTGNEPVTYELLNDPKRGFRAHNVVLFGVFQPSVRAKGHRTLQPVMVALLVTGIGIYTWQHLSSNGLKVLPRVKSMLGVENTTKFQCQGKRYCSEMTSCEEATFYLKNCSGVEIDGDGNGIPCESQLCGH